MGRMTLTPSTVSLLGAVTIHPDAGARLVDAVARYGEEEEGPSAASSSSASSATSSSVGTVASVLLPPAHEEDLRTASDAPGPLPRLTVWQRLRVRLFGTTSPVTNAAYPARHLADAALASVPLADMWRAAVNEWVTTTLEPAMDRELDRWSVPQLAQLAFAQPDRAPRSTLRVPLAPLLRHLATRLAWSVRFVPVDRWQSALLSVWQQQEPPLGGGGVGGIPPTPVPDAAPVDHADIARTLEQECLHRLQAWLEPQALAVQPEGPIDDLHAALRSHPRVAAALDLWAYRIGAGARQQTSWRWRLQPAPALDWCVSWSMPSPVPLTPAVIAAEPCTRTATSAVLVFQYAHTPASALDGGGALAYEPGREHGWWWAASPAAWRHQHGAMLPPGTRVLMVSLTRAPTEPWQRGWQETARHQETKTRAGQWVRAGPAANGEPPRLPRLAARRLVLLALGPCPDTDLFAWRAPGTRGGHQARQVAWAHLVNAWAHDPDVPAGPVDPHLQGPVVHEFVFTDTPGLGVREVRAWALSGRVRRPFGLHSTVLGVPVAQVRSLIEHFRVGMEAGDVQRLLTWKRVPCLFPGRACMDVLALHQVYDYSERLPTCVTAPSFDTTDGGHEQHDTLGRLELVTQHSHDLPSTAVPTSNGTDDAEGDADADADADAGPDVGDHDHDHDHQPEPAADSLATPASAVRSTRSWWWPLG